MTVAGRLAAVPHSAGPVSQSIMSSLPAHLLEPVGSADSLPTWWADILAASAARLSSSTVPTDAEEVWRYSRIESLDLASFPLAADSSGVDLSEHGVIDATTSIVVAVVDGRVGAVTGAPVPSGVYVGALSGHPSAADFWQAVHVDAIDVFAEITARHALDPLVIDIGRGERITVPIVVRVHAASARSSSVPHLLIRVADNASVTVLEHHTSVDEPVLVMARTDSLVGVGSHLAHGVIQALAPSAWSISNTVVRGSASSHAEYGLAAVGGSTARARTDCRLVGRGREPTCQRCTTAAATRRTTSEPSSTIRPATPPAIWCSKASSMTTPDRSTPA